MKLLIISDIHGNRDALEAVLSIPHDEVVCLGDLVDYGPEPAECIDIMKFRQIPVMKGNHDNAVAYRVDCGCGYKYKHLSISTREYTWENLDESHIIFLKKLPMYLEKEFGDNKEYFTHGSPSSIYEYINPESPDEEVLEMLEGVDADIIVIGHSHIPFIRKLGDMTIINPGSVGQPRDGSNIASCAMFDTESHDAELISCDYDLDVVCSKIKEKMPHSDELIEILKRGY